MGVSNRSSTVTCRVRGVPRTQPDLFKSSEPATSGHVFLGLAERRRVQMGLQALGFDPGPADGLFGPKTTAAIAAWKEAKGYEPTGLLTREQAEALMAVAAASRPERQIAQPDARTQAHIPPGPFRDCPSCPEMVVVPAGSFTMGSPSSEDERDGDEGPLRRVTIPAPFAVGKYEVTFGEWDACVAAGGCRSYRPDDEGWGRGLHPVTNVSREDAKAYADWLSRTTGKPYRLLTEAEWEYVARAGTQTSRYWGDSTRKQCEHANGFDDSAKNEVDQVFWRAAQCDDGSRYTSHIGQFGRTASGCPTCWAMFGSGWRTAGTTATPALPRMAAPGPRWAIAPSACCEADIGATIRKPSAPRTGPRAGPRSATTVTASG